MPETSPIVASGAALLALALLLVPGWVMLLLVRMRGLLALALAPACSTAVLGCGAILAQIAGLVWSVPVALASGALGLLLALLVRRLAQRAPASPPLTRADSALLGAGVALAVVPPLVAMGSVDVYLQRWDAVFHLAALQFVHETGSASTLTLGALSYGDGHASIYPAGWHALAALLPGSPTAVLVIGATVTAAVPWVLGCGLLAGELTRSAGRPFFGAGAVGIGGLLAGLVTASPMSLWTGWGHVPNAAALAMLPAALALAMRLARERRGRPAGTIVLLVALLGMALTHPNALLAAGVLALPALLGAIMRATRGSGSGLAWPALAATGVVGLLLVFLLTPLAAAVTGYASPETEPVGTATLHAVTGWYRLWPTATGVVVALLALAAAIVMLAQGRRLPALTLLITWLVYVDAATGGHLQISSLWYTSTARLSVVVTAVAVPLAAAGLVMAAERLRRHAGAVLPAAVGALLVVALAVPSIGGRTFRTANVFQDEPGHPPQFVTTGELEMIANLPDVVDGTILGSPFSGAASVYGLTGLPVTFPVAGQVWSLDQQLIMEHLDELASGEVSPQVCDAVERLDIRYLYQDSEPYQRDQRYEALEDLEPAGATMIAQGDTARVLELTMCSR